MRERDDVEGIDSSIIAHPRTWEASGHVEHFSDPMVDCRACKKRFRADQLDDAGPCPARQGTLRARLDRGAQLQPDAEDLHRRAGGRGRDRVPARRDLPVDLHSTSSACARARARRSRSASRRSARPSATRSTRATSPSARASSSRWSWSSSATRREREKWFEHWLGERLRFHHELGFGDERLRMRPHASRRARALRQRGRRHRVPLPVRLAGDRGRPRPRRLGPAPPQRVLGQGPRDHRRGDQGALRADGDRDLGRAWIAPASRCSATPTRRRALADGETRTRAAAAARGRADQGRRAAALEEARRAGAAARAPSCAAASSVFYDEPGNIGRRYRRQDEVGTPFCVTYRLRVRERRQGDGARPRLDDAGADRRGRASARELQDRLETAR